jgi:hypothetical protein
MLSRQEEAINHSKTRTPRLITKTTKALMINTIRMGTIQHRPHHRPVLRTRTTTIMGMKPTVKHKIRLISNQHRHCSSKTTIRTSTMQEAALDKLMLARSLLRQVTIQHRTSITQRHRQLINQHSRHKHSSRRRRCNSHWKSSTPINH